MRLFVQLGSSCIYTDSPTMDRLASVLGLLACGTETAGKPATRRDNTGSGYTECTGCFYYYSALLTPTEVERANAAVSLLTAAGIDAFVTDMPLGRVK